MLQGKVDNIVADLVRDAVPDRPWPGRAVGKRIDATIAPPGIREHLKDADRLFMDETRAPVLDPGRRRTKTGFFWAVVADDRGHGGAGPPIVMFHYAPGQGAVHALRILEGYRGEFVQCDGYDAYDKLTAVDRPEGPWTLVHCWTHARRRFVKRLEKDGSPIAEEALRQIAEL